MTMLTIAQRILIIAIRTCIFFCSVVRRYRSHGVASLQTTVAVNRDSVHSKTVNDNPWPLLKPRYRSLLRAVLLLGKLRL